MPTILEAVQTAYNTYTQKHGCDPTMLKCSQAVYHSIEHELHCDWHGGDLRFMEAEVVVSEGMEGFEFGQ